MTSIFSNFFSAIDNIWSALSLKPFNSPATCEIGLPICLLNSSPITSPLDKKSSTKFEKIKLFYLNKIDILLKESESLLWLIPQKSLKRETFVILYIAKKLTELLKKNDPLKKKVKLSYIDLIFCYFKGIIKVLKNNKSFKSM